MSVHEQSYHDPAPNALATLVPGDLVTVNLKSESIESWTGTIVSADMVAIRLEAIGSRMGPISCAEDCTLIIPWRRIDWIDLEGAARDHSDAASERVEAMYRMAPRLSRAQLLANVDRFQVEMDNARNRGDLRTHLQASAYWNATWDELDRRDLAVQRQAS